VSLTLRPKSLTSCASLAFLLSASSTLSSASLALLSASSLSLCASSLSLSAFSALCACSRTFKAACSIYSNLLVSRNIPSVQKTYRRKKFKCRMDLPDKRFISGINWGSRISTTRFRTITTNNLRKFHLEDGTDQIRVPIALGSESEISIAVIVNQFSEIT
jgi:hypothetical protein